VVRSSVYAFLRHPLFVGGVIISVGLGLMGGEVSLLLAAMNIAALPFYARFEDARCARVFGAHYDDYRASVGAVMPRLTGPRPKGLKRPGGAPARAPGRR
jgi:protein-S-isoprenylcysteine O-methyltransferase Ste14